MSLEIVIIGLLIIILVIQIYDIKYLRKDNKIYNEEIPKKNNDEYDEEVKRYRRKKMMEKKKKRVEFDDSSLDNINSILK